MSILSFSKILNAQPAPGHQTPSQLLGISCKMEKKGKQAITFAHLLVDGKNPDLKSFGIVTRPKDFYIDAGVNT